MACKGKCEERKTNRTGTKKIGEGNLKWCRECDSYILDPEIRCNCCGKLYRTKPKYSKTRKKLAMKVAIK